MLFVVSSTKAAVYGGRGWVSAHLQNGRFFQLAEIAGVDKELGLLLSRPTILYSGPRQPLTADLVTGQAPDFGNPYNLYALSEETEIY